MGSDDTEHTVMVAESLILARGNRVLFTKYLAKAFRFWLLRIPAGIGLATLKSIIKLWLGFSPNSSGVNSAGNSPAMRSAILGVVYSVRDLVEFVQSSTRITHNHPRAEMGAIAIALAANLASRNYLVTVDQYYQELCKLVPELPTDFADIIDRLMISIQHQEDTLSFAQQLNLSAGVSGYIYHTVPIVLHAWFSFPRDYYQGVLTVIKCGGDTDTTAAILGRIIGYAVDKFGIAEQWLKNLWE